MGRIPREDVAFPSAPDPRFGGNLARGTAGAQYPGASGDYYGGPSRGSPMLDRRYENYVAPRPADYTRNVPIQTGTPNFRPPYGAPGQPSYSEWRQQKDPFHTGPYPPSKKHPNPRMREREMAGGLGGLRRPKDFINLDMSGRPDLSFKYSHMKPSEGMGLGGRLDKAILVDPITGYPDDMIRGTWRRTENSNMAEDMDEYGYLEGAPRQTTTFSEGYIPPHVFNEMYGGVYDDAIFRIVDPNTNRIEQYPQAGDFDNPPMEGQQSKVNLMDLYDRLGGDINWSRLLRQMDQRGIEYSNRGGLMSLRR
tara:strand:+ start:54 stop:977 length:924 start_codon:yes stop_codon:yes gene_type:complete